MNFTDDALCTDCWVEGRLLCLFLLLSPYSFTKVPAMVLAERSPTCSSCFVVDWFFWVWLLISEMSLLIGLAFGYASDSLIAEHLRLMVFL